MPKRILQGTVITASSEKTIVVKVERRVRHPLYKKTIKRSNKLTINSLLLLIKKYKTKKASKPCINMSMPICGGTLLR